MRLQRASGDCGADADQDNPAEGLAVFACLSAEPATEFESGQGQADADRADYDSGGNKAHMIGTEGEADREVVDAERGTGDDKPPGVLPRGRGGLAVIVAVTAAAG